MSFFRRHHIIAEVVGALFILLGIGVCAYVGVYVCVVKSAEGISNVIKTGWSIWNFVKICWGLFKIFCMTPSMVLTSILLVVLGLDIASASDN